MRVVTQQLAGCHQRAHRRQINSRIPSVGRQMSPVGYTHPLGGPGKTCRLPQPLTAQSSAHRWSIRGSSASATDSWSGGLGRWESFSSAWVSSAAVVSAGGLSQEPRGVPSEPTLPMQAGCHAGALIQVTEGTRHPVSRITIV